MIRAHNMAFPVEMCCPLEDYDDILYEVLKYSKLSLVAIACVNKQFNALTKKYAENYRPEGCFGRVEWLSFGGDPGIEPHLPLKMIQDFDASKEMLTLIPESINDEPLTLSSIDAFISKHKNSDKSNYTFPLSQHGIYDNTVKKFKSHFVILSKDVLLATKNKNFRKQAYAVKKQGFEIPNLIDTVVSLFMHNLKTGEFIYPSYCYSTGNSQLTYTRVREKNKKNYRIIIGAFCAHNLYIGYNITYNASFIGVACARKSIGD